MRSTVAGAGVAAGHAAVAGRRRVAARRCPRSSTSRPGASGTGCRRRRGSRARSGWPSRRRRGPTSRRRSRRRRRSRSCRSPGTRRPPDPGGTPRCGRWRTRRNACRSDRRSAARRSHRRPGTARTARRPARCRSAAAARCSRRRCAQPRAAAHADAVGDPEARLCRSGSRCAARSRSPGCRSCRRRRPGRSRRGRTRYRRPRRRSRRCRDRRGTAARLAEHIVTLPAVHSLHAPASGPDGMQNGRSGSGQLGAPSPVQPTQVRLVGEQTGVTPPQCALTRQATQTPTPDATSQRGAAAGQCDTSSAVQAAHAPVGRQIGVAPPHSACEAHARQTLLPPSHTGVVPLHCAVAEAGDAHARGDVADRRRAVAAAGVAGRALAAGAARLARRQRAAALGVGRAATAGEAAGVADAGSAPRSRCWRGSRRNGPPRSRTAAWRPCTRRRSTPSTGRTRRSPGTPASTPPHSPSPAQARHTCVVRLHTGVAPAAARVRDAAHADARADVARRGRARAAAALARRALAARAARLARRRRAAALAVARAARGSCALAPSQIGVVAAALGVDVRHATHVPVGVWHSGVVPVHAVPFPAEHWPHAPPGWHAGVAPPHSPSPAQPRQEWNAGSQTGVAPGQSVSARHETHVPRRRVADAASCRCTGSCCPPSTGRTRRSPGRPASRRRTRRRPRRPGTCGSRGCTPAVAPPHSRVRHAADAGAARDVAGGRRARAPGLVGGRADAARAARLAGRRRARAAVAVAAAGAARVRRAVADGRGAAALRVGHARHAGAGRRRGRPASRPCSARRWSPSTARTRRPAGRPASRRCRTRRRPRRRGRCASRRCTPASRRRSRASARHVTHVPAGVKQTGVVPPQRDALLAEHWPHAPLGWQAGVAPAALAVARARPAGVRRDVAHRRRPAALRVASRTARTSPTGRRTRASRPRTGVAFVAEQMPARAARAGTPASRRRSRRRRRTARQVCVARLQTGVAPPHCAFEMHGTQLPTARGRPASRRRSWWRWSPSTGRTRRSAGTPACRRRTRRRPRRRGRCGTRCCRPASRPSSRAFDRQPTQVPAGA